MFGEIDFSHTAPAQELDDPELIKKVPVFEHPFFFRSGHIAPGKGIPILTQIGQAVIVDHGAALGAAVVLFVENGDRDFDLDMALMADEQRLKVTGGRVCAALRTSYSCRELHPLVFKVEPVSALRTIKNMLKHQKIPPADDESKVA
jgi:hypothetical protein